jgi:hypothetical protein
VLEGLRGEDSIAELCRRRITLNKFTFITPLYLPPLCQWEWIYTWVNFGCKSTPVGRFVGSMQASPVE